MRPTEEEETEEICICLIWKDQKCKKVMQAFLCHLSIYFNKSILPNDVEMHLTLVA